MGTKQPCLGDESQILGMAAGFPPLHHLITPLHPKFDSNRTFARAEKLPSKEQGSCMTQQPNGSWSFPLKDKKPFRFFLNVNPFFSEGSFRQTFQRHNRLKRPHPLCFWEVRMQVQLAALAQARAPEPLKTYHKADWVGLSMAKLCMLFIPDSQGNAEPRHCGCLSQRATKASLPLLMATINTPKCRFVVFDMKLNACKPDQLLIIFHVCVI